MFWTLSAPSFNSFASSRLKLAIIILLLSTIHRTSASEPTANQTSSIGTNSTNGCIDITLPSGSDVFGAGVRISFYIQWAAAMFSTWFENEEAVGAMRTNSNIFTIAIFISQTIFRVKASKGQYFKTLFQYKPGRVTEAETVEAFVLSVLALAFFTIYTNRRFNIRPLLVTTPAETNYLSYACMSAVTAFAAIGLAIQTGLSVQGIRSEEYSCINYAERVEQVKKWRAMNSVSRNGEVFAQWLICFLVSAIAAILVAATVADLRKFYQQISKEKDRPQNVRREGTDGMEDEWRDEWFLLSLALIPTQLMLGWVFIRIIESALEYPDWQGLDGPTDSLGQILALVASVVTLCATLRRCFMPAILRWIRSKRRKTPQDRDIDEFHTTPLLPLDSNP